MHNTKNRPLIYSSAVIDIGSSSVRMLIGERHGQEIRIVEKLRNPITIGKDTFYNGSISQDTINQVLVHLENYKQLIKEYNITQVIGIATTAVREAKNRDIFIDTLYRKTGFKIEVLSAGDVVYYMDSYLAHKLQNTYPIHDKNVLIAELSTSNLDVSVMGKGLVLSSLGLPIGALRIKQIINDLEGSYEEINKAVKEYIENEFLHLKRSIPVSIDDIILIDEQYSDFLSRFISLEDKSSYFFQIDQKQSSEILSQLADKTVEEITKEYDLPRDLAETYLSYVIILNLLYLNKNQNQVHLLKISLSEAILAHKLLKIELSDKYNKTNQLISTAKYICEKYNSDITHAAYVAGICNDLFIALQDTLGLADDVLIYLTLSSYLHDIGNFVHNRAHHKHSEYIITSLNLFRLSEDEISLIACIARYHRKATPDPIHPIYNSLSNPKRLLVQKLSAILRIANSLDRSHKQKIKKIAVEQNKQQLTIVAYSTDSLLLELADFADKKRFFEEITGHSIRLITRSF